MSGMGVDGAHNTIGKMSTPTTLLGEVAGYCPAGVQGTVLGIVVDLSALPYFLRPFPGPRRAGVPGRLVPVGPDCARRRRAISRGSAHPRRRGRSRKWWLARPFGRRGRPEAGRSRKRALFLLSEAFRLERRAGVGSERCSSLVRPSSRRGEPGSEAGVVPP